MFSQALAHENSKNKIRHRNRGRNLEDKREMERSTAGWKKYVPTALTIVRAYRPPGVSTPRIAVDELPNEPNLYTYSPPTTPGKNQMHKQARFQSWVHNHFGTKLFKQ